MLVRRDRLRRESGRPERGQRVVMRLPTRDVTSPALGRGAIGAAVAAAGVVVLSGAMLPLRSHLSLATSALVQSVPEIVIEIKLSSPHDV